MTLVIKSRLGPTTSMYGVTFAGLKGAPDVRVSAPSTSGMGSFPVFSLPFIHVGGRNIYHVKAKYLSYIWNGTS